MTDPIPRGAVLPCTASPIWQSTSNH